MKIQTLKLEGRKTISLLTGINREVITKHVTKLANSITKMGIIRPMVVCTISFITGKPTTYILDGQHLFHACIREKLDIPYVEIEIKDMQELVETIALLNSSSKSWATSDYVLSWSTLHEDYKKLMHYLNVYPLDIRFIAGVLSGNSNAGGSMGQVIRRGEFKVKDEKFAVKLFDNIVNVNKIAGIKNKRVIIVGRKQYT